MPNIRLPEPGRPYVLVEPSGEQQIADIDRSLIIDLYKAHGALLFRGFGVDVSDFRNFTQALCPTHVVNEIGGRLPIEPEHNIHTAASGVGAFPLHSELSREPWKPDVAFFGCLSAPTRGGTTTICDGIELARAMPKEVRQALMGRRLLYMVAAWPELLQFWLGDSNPSDERLRNPPPWCPFQFDRSDGIVVRYFSRPVLHRPMFSDELAFANFLLFARFKLNLRDYPLLDDGKPVPEPWLQAIKAAGDQVAAEVVWQAGDMLMLDNTRFMHGRTPITDASERRIVTFFGFLDFAVPDPEEPPNALWRQGNFRPPVPPHMRTRTLEAQGATGPSH